MNPELGTNVRLESLPEGSRIGDCSLEVGVSPAPSAATAMLPERYGIPQFEFLVVDPEYVFIVWEITSDQLLSFKDSVGEIAFEQRSLRVRILDPAQPDLIVQERELYGEQGRWFVALSRDGYWAQAQLGFAHGNDFTKLMAAGPVAIPRTLPVECSDYEELHVVYSVGATGETVIKSIRDAANPGWPQISLPQVPLADIQPGVGIEAAGAGSAARTDSKLPSSPFTWISSRNLPSSPGRGW